MNRRDRRSFNKKFKKRAREFRDKNKLDDTESAKKFLKEMKQGIHADRLPELHKKIDALTDKEVQELIGSIVTFD